ncbi:MAG: hypothetical protein IT523_04840 [Burkholderiales bacterium]|nr:hypothetical protein [Burkholderiales bacterium]
MAATSRSMIHAHTIQLGDGRRIHNGLEARKAAKVDLKFQKNAHGERKSNFLLPINVLHDRQRASRANQRRANGVVA